MHQSLDAVEGGRPLVVEDLFTYHEGTRVIDGIRKRGDSL